MVAVKPANTTKGLFLQVCVRGSSPLSASVTHRTAATLNHLNSSTFFKPPLPLKALWLKQGDWCRRDAAMIIERMPENLPDGNLDCA
jgi:hypothetical protein